MSRPSSLPPAEHFRHGTRARYVCGCRCEPCRQSNRRKHRRRNQLGIRLVKQLPPLDPVPVLRTHTIHGKKYDRIYQLGCPGIDADNPCPTKSFLRKDSINGRCRKCRERLAWDGLVDASRAREHLQMLSRHGVGRDAVSDIARMAASNVDKIRTGQRRQIRAQAERRILGVTTAARAGDRSLVPAGPTWRRLRRMLNEEDMTKRELARRLGSKAQSPALQIGTTQVTAASEMKVRRLFELLYAEAT